MIGFETLRSRPMPTERMECNKLRPLANSETTLFLRRPYPGTTS